MITDLTALIAARFAELEAENNRLKNELSNATRRAWIAEENCKFPPATCDCANISMRSKRELRAMLATDLPYRRRLAIEKIIDMFKDRDEDKGICAKWGELNNYV